MKRHEIIEFTQEILDRITNIKASGRTTIVIDSHEGGVRQYFAEHGKKPAKLSKCDDISRIIPG